MKSKTFIGSTMSKEVGQTSTADDTSPHPHLFLVMRANRVLTAPSRHGLRGVEEATIGRGNTGATREVIDGKQHLRVALNDGWMSTDHCKLFDSLGHWVVEDCDSRNGTMVNGAKVKRAPLSDGDLIEVGHSFFIFRDLLPSHPKDELDYTAEAPGAARALATLIPTLASQFSSITQVARSTVSVIIQGESGTGKEVVAQALHDLSRRQGPFTAVNCGAMPETLVETELFGYRKGAFSGALEDRPGLVRSADKGTLFLDEIGDLPAASQAAFLRVLQEKQVTPVGGTKPVPVDIRLVAATHRPLDALVQAGEFRSDLFARIGGFTVRLPPLRQRREDLGLLISSILQRIAPGRAEEIEFGTKAARAILRYHWPLNVRELEKCLEAAVVLAQGEPIEYKHLPEPVRASLASLPVEAPAAPVVVEVQDTEEDLARRDELSALLTEHNGNLSAVARAMNKDRVQVRRWIRRYRLDPKTFK